jgi:PS-10 peptidase S37
VKTWARRSLYGVMLSTVIGIGSVVPAMAKPAVAEDDIVDKLKAIPGMTVLGEEPSGDPAYRYFLLTYRQPADHRDPGKGTFEQRLSLLHKAADRPMVLFTSGYQLPSKAGKSEPTTLVDGNQLSVEQRFFSPSRPDPADWTKLNIWQAATDHHRLVEAIKPLYAGSKWVSTGGSKGGMTSVYHRRFYPKDIDGTIAYVAPNDVDNKKDAVYTDFFGKVGNDPACRQALNDLQVEALKRRDTLVPKYEAYAAENGLTFKQMGTIDKAFEGVVLDTPWAFWQYQLQENCAEVPKTTATDDELFAWYDGITGWAGYSDQGTEPYVPYYFQAATQLGWPAVKYPHLEGLLRYPGANEAPQAVPPELPVKFDKGAMRDVDRWIKKDGGQLMFLYGANDPWGAEPFELGKGTKDSYWYEVEGLNHNGRLIGMLPEQQKQEATAALLRWTGQSAQLAQQRRAPSPLDSFDELRGRRPPL